MQASLPPCGWEVEVDHVPRGTAGSGPWARGLVDTLGFSHSRCAGRLMWCLWGSLPTNSTAQVPSTCLMWDCLYKQSCGSLAHTHKVEVNKPGTGSGHVASLYRRPRYSHVPVSMFLLSMLILAGVSLHWSEGLAKLKHQAKVCLWGCPFFSLPIQWATFCPKYSMESSSHRGLARTTLCLASSSESSFMWKEEREWLFPHWLCFRMRWRGLRWEKHINTG